MVAVKNGAQIELLESAVDLEISQEFPSSRRNTDHELDIQDFCPDQGRSDGSVSIRSF